MHRVRRGERGGGVRGLGHRHGLVLQGARRHLLLHHGAQGLRLPPAGRGVRRGDGRRAGVGLQEPWPAVARPQGLPQPPLQLLSHGGRQGVSW